MRRLLPVLAVLSVFAVGPAQGQTMYLGTAVGQPYTTPDHRGFLDQIVAELFRRLGRTAEVTRYESSARALINANSGGDDGQALRVKGLEQQYGNLMRIPEKLIDNDFVAYAVKDGVSTAAWSGLKPHVVTHIIGWKIFEDNLQDMGMVIPAQNEEQMFTLLAKGRAEVALYERWQGQALVRRLGLAARVVEPPLARREMFLYLHKKHAALLEPAAAALAAMKADGTYQAIFERTLGPLN